MVRKGADYPLGANIAQFLLVVGLGPLVEEMLFRGFLFRRWSRKWGLRKGAVLSSLAFAVVHADVLGAWFFGFVLALLYARTWSLWLPIIVHSVNNALAWCLEGLGVLVGESEQLSIDEFQSSWWFGGLCLVVSVPWLVRFIRQNWPSSESRVPGVA